MMTPPDAPRPLSRNVLIHNGENSARFRGEWVAIPREDFDAARSASPDPDAGEHVDVVAIGEAASSALNELDNIRWDDIWEALGIAERPDLAEWTRSYVGYVRADIQKVIDALSETPR